MRIVHYHPDIVLSKGGVVRAVLDLCAALAARGHDVTLATPVDRDVPASWRVAATSGPRTPRLLSLPSPARPMALFAHGQLDPLKSAIRAADAVHLHGMWTNANVQVARIARRAGVPYVLSPHGMLTDYSMSQKSLKKRLYLLVAGRRLLDGAAAVCFTAEAELAQAARYHPRTRGVAIPLLFDTSPFRRLPGPDAARAAFGAFSRGLPVVLLLGRVAEKKGGDVLLRAAALLRNRGVDVAVAFAGAAESGFDARLRDLAMELRVNDRVELLGQVEGDLKLSVCQASTLAAVPSIDENFGLVVPEVLCAGLPAIVTPGVMIAPEIARAGGCVLADRTPEAFATAIGELLASPERRHQVARTGREWVDSALDADATIRRYEDLYGGLGAPTDRRRPG